MVAPLPAGCVCTGTDKGIFVAEPVFGSSAVHYLLQVRIMLPKYEVLVLGGGGGGTGIHRNQ